MPLQLAAPADCGSPPRLPAGMLDAAAQLLGTSTAAGLCMAEQSWYLKPLAHDVVLASLCLHEAASLASATQHSTLR